MYFSVLLTTTIAVLLALLPHSKAVDIPDPAPHDMPWKVAHNRSFLVDTSRKDPYDPTEDQKVAYSVFLPVRTCSSTVDNLYMPDRTAKASNLQFFGSENANVFEKLHFKTCSGVTDKILLAKFPLIFFEPAAGTTRLLYSQLARQLSANGAIVVTVDHTYDASVVEFGDGSFTTKAGRSGLESFEINKPWDNDIATAVQARTDDINAVIKELQRLDTWKKLFPDIAFENEQLNTAKIHIVGHGLGGTVATSMAAEDPRVYWVTNLSGSVPQVANDIESYVVFFGRENYSRNDDPAWVQAQKHFTGLFAEWTYKKADQFDYSDLPLVSHLVDPKKEAKGLGKPYEIMKQGPESTFNCLSCFLEAYFRDTVLPSWPIDLPGKEGRNELSTCMRYFTPAMLPYQA